MKSNYLYPILLSLLALGSCSKWIDVKPTDRLSETVLFSNQAGYLKALNGIYIEMSQPVLYGQFMTAEVIDLLGQYYMTSNSTAGITSLPSYATYDYTKPLTKSGFDSAWKKSYNIISSLNVLLHNCAEGPSSKLPEPYYGLVKGEALALRAFLHFDMLRLFGPIWTAANKGEPAIPYYTNTSLEIAPLYTSEQVMKFIVTDLEEAQILLKKSDPILTEGVRDYAGAGGSNDFHYRQYRLNYFATKALLARTYLWQGDRARAGSLAREIITEVQQPGAEIFPFVTAAAATSTSIPDRVFASEVMFSIYTINRSTVYNSLFAASQSLNLRLAPNLGNTDMTRVNAMYDDKNDYRYKIWENANMIGIPLTTNQKYKDIVNAPGRYMIPLMRLSELYLMVAECSDDLSESTRYLNILRLKRNAFDIFPADQVGLKNAITAEFRKEMIGEGQQFYYYKRRAFTEVPNHNALTGNKLISLANYTVPLPESETSLRAKTK